MRKVWWVVGFAGIVIQITMSDLSRADGLILGNPYNISSSLYENFDVMDYAGTVAPNTNLLGDTAWSVRVSGSEYCTSLQPRANVDGPGFEHHSGSNCGYNGGFLISKERSLGVYAGAVGDSRELVAAFRNTSGASVTSIVVYYDLEMWADRTPNLGMWGGFNLQYSSNGSNWTDMGSEFDGSISTDQAPSNTSSYWLTEDHSIRNIGGEFVLPAPLADGDVFYLRWNGLSGVPMPMGASSGNRKRCGMFIDNLQIDLLTAGSPPVSPSRITAPPLKDNVFREWLASFFSPEEQIE